MNRWLIFFLIISVGLSASININYRSQPLSEEIRTQEIDNIEYFNIFELDKVFKALITADLLDQRLYVNIYGSQITFLLDSSYLQFMGEDYNFQYPIILQKEKYFLPITFLTDILPILFPQKITFSSNTIIADTPIDNSIKTIVLDPGHGGKDPGAVGYSKKNFEKNVALQVARKLKEKLEAALDVQVLLTRSKDEFVSLQSRTDFANKIDADLFISLHCNAHRNKQVKGIEVYYLSTAKTDEARAVEAMENSVVFDFEGGDKAVQQYNDLAFILADMAQNEHLEESYRISSYLQDNLTKQTTSYNRGVKQANFYVLRGAYMPSVLVEMGFISNKSGEQKLVSASYQKKIVNSIFESVRAFKFKYDKMR
ncbi:MAG: N-acetylmuramoyl-L-alanine amidase [Candidatus Cloacimonetes bacterium]|nr:N-acetylmuramoyl-L-alanine amidase [Candidatus Cloacimonadota bacterium]